MSELQATKPIKIHWITPNGKTYQDVIPMTLDQYTEFVNSLLKMKRDNKEVSKQ